MCKLTSAFSKIESEVSAQNKSNSLSSSRLVNTDPQIWANVQYSRRECLDTIDVPREVEADVWEKKIEISEKLGCNIPPKRIEACQKS